MKWLRLCARNFGARLSMGQALEEERRSRASLEILNSGLQRENEFLRERFDKALDGERNALRMLVNVQMQLKYGITPYPDAPSMPANDPNKPIEQPSPARVQGVDMVSGARNRFIEELERRQASGEHIPVGADVLRAALNGI